MSHWNYRVFRDEHGNLTIRETYYNDAGEVVHWSLGGEAVVGDTIEDLHDGLHKMSEALTKPIVDIEELRTAP
jgi:hypothetical protein